jgi:GH43 family beta-xylosidase
MRMPFPLAVRVLVGFVFAATALACTATAAENALQWANPLVEQRADPHVTLHDGQYYLIATAPEYDRIELRRAPTLDGLRSAEARVLWRRHESGPMSWHIWAPELHRLDGKWYIYFAAGRAEKIWDIRMWVLENAAADPFAGEWIEKGQIKTQWETFSLDATVFEHRGTRYLAWAQRDPSFKSNSNIYLAKMDTPWSIAGPQVMLTKAELPWEKTKLLVNEGPAVLIRNGRVFMVYSANATDATYALGVLTADEKADLLDPKSWVKSPEAVFLSSDAAGQFGPGHNSFTTTPDGRTDINVYHARNYKEIRGDPLKNPDRHTRAQVVRWRADGTPDFGTPVADGLYSVMADATVMTGKRAPKPLFRDPVHDGAADPVVIWNAAEKKWFMFYTNRRANVAGEPGSVAWVHGTKIGIAESSDAGATWTYRGVAEIGHGGPDTTHWAPDVIEHAGTYHMYLTIVPGIFNDWNHPRDIVHLTSTDLLKWEYRSTLKLASDRVIDARVFPLAGGGWRLWYNNERDRKSIYYADSADLFTWENKGKVAGVGERPGEGPYVFRWKDKYWMLVDLWRGLGVYRSDDLANWQAQVGDLLARPGSGPDDGVNGGHPGVVVSGDRAFLFYFTHPGSAGTIKVGEKDGYEMRRSSIQVVELHEKDGQLSCNRDEPTFVKLSPP